MEKALRWVWLVQKLDLIWRALEWMTANRKLAKSSEMALISSKLKNSRMNNRNSKVCKSSKARPNLKSSRMDDKNSKAWKTLLNGVLSSRKLIHIWKPLEWTAGWVWSVQKLDQICKALEKLTATQKLAKNYEILWIVFKNSTKSEKL